MRKRLFFIVKQLNYIGSAELAAVSFTSCLNEEYDVFLYSIQEINNGKINGCYNVNPRVTIRSLNVPVDVVDTKTYFKENAEKVSELLSISSRDDDVFILFSDKLLDYIKKDVKKILIKGFSKVCDYSLFDKVVFLIKSEYESEIKKDPSLAEKAFLFTPFLRFDRTEDFKFHGNRIMCVTRIDQEDDFDPVLDLVYSLKQKEFKFIIAVCGEGEKISNVEKIVIEKGLTDVIEFRDVKEITKSYSDSDLFFYYSKGNHYPMFLIESMSFSLPIVSISKNTYSYDIISNVGIIANNMQEAAEKIYTLLKDKIKLAKLKFETYEYSKRFVKENSIGQLKRIIESTIVKYE